MKQVLRALAKDNTLLVVSSNFTGPMMHLLRRDAINKKFTVVSGADHSPSKTRRVADILSWLHADPKQAFYVTDTVGDVKETKPLGMRIVGVSWGFHSATALKRAGAAIIAKTPKDLLKIK